MHIPFTKDHVQAQERHVVTLEDRGANSADEDFSTIDEPASPSTVKKLSNAITNAPSYKPHQAVQLPDGVIDVLYENQRGSFLCGIPLFSSAGLWVTDPYAWVNIEYKYSPFTVFNATVPDPTWEWVWRRWFVDMSGDVDENGWSYNINFTRHHWHGHHIWYHSFVRRRRWLRKRRKTPSSKKTVRKANNPTEDYFTISSSTYKTTKTQTDGTQDFCHQEEDEHVSEKLENVGDLYDRLRSARLDREKLDAMDNFLQNSTELAALATEMRHILGFMIFQESRRQLLVLLARRCREIEKQHVPPRGDEGQFSRHQCVQNAIDMAEALIPTLDYFSDRVRCSKEEQDAELDRVQAAQLQKQQTRHNAILQGSAQPNDFKVDSMQQTADASNSTQNGAIEDSKHPGKREKKNVTFRETNAETIDASKEYSAAEKGKAKEH